jgi:hypothetical protein
MFLIAGAFPGAHHPPADPPLVDRLHDPGGVRAVVIMGPGFQVIRVTGVVPRLALGLVRVADRRVEVD